VLGVFVRRYVNEEVAAKAGGFDANDGSQFEFVCECGDLLCHGLVELTLAEFRASAPGSVIGH
jgi:hypothetical protein